MIGNFAIPCEGIEVKSKYSKGSKFFVVVVVAFCK